MSAHPIWSRFSADMKLFARGARKSLKQLIYIGSSSKNSFLFAQVETRMMHNPTMSENTTWRFELLVDGTVIKYGIFADNNGRPGELLHTGDDE